MNLNKTISVFGSKMENPPKGGDPWGPSKVVHNLLKGLGELGLKYYEDNHTEGDYNILINNTLIDDFLKVSPSKKNTLIGPCVEAHLGSHGLPYNHFLAASNWHKRLYKECEPQKSKNKTIDVWPIGIDIDFYKPNKKQIEYDCLFHYKHPRQGFDGINIVEDLMSKFKQTIHPKHLIDGQYNPQELVERCNSCKYIIVISGSETQGIGKMEMLSTNTPMFVLDSNCHYAFGSLWSPFPASSVPFWSDECGIKLHEKDYTKEYREVKNPRCENNNQEGGRLTKWRKKQLENSIELQDPIPGKTINKDFVYEKFYKFINNLTSYQPRDYIINNHTIEQSTKNLINIFKKYE